MKRSNRESDVFQNFHKISTAENHKFPKFSCQFCNWVTARNSTRMVSHLIKCNSCPDGIKKKYILSKARVIIQTQNLKPSEPDLPDLSGYSLNYKPDIEDIEAKYDPLNHSEEQLEDDYENEEGDELEDEQEAEPELNEAEGSSSHANQSERPRSERRRSDQHYEQRRRMRSPGMPRGPRFSHLPEWQRMSVVPMMFRDWWDEWETPMRSSRLLDQHFGTGLRRDDISSFTNTPSLLRSGYIRPWRNTSLQRQDSGSVLNCEKDKFQVILDVQQFIPNEITVKTTDKFIIVEGKHEEKQDEHGFVSRQFQRRYMLPRDINPNDITSTLSSDGVLTITAPKKNVPPPETERTVPIQQTGPSSKETQPKIDHIQAPRSSMNF